MVYTDYLSYNVFLLKIGGLYEIDKSNNRARCFFGYSRRILCNLILAIGFVAIGYQICSNGVFNFTENTVGYVPLAGLGCTLLRAIYFCINDKKTKKLVERANALFKYETETLLIEKSMKRRVNMTNKLTLIWLIYLEIAGFVLTLYPFYTGTWKNRVLAYPMWLPYDWNVSPLYEITCAMQVGFFLIAAWIISSVDGFFTSILLLTAEQFKLLGWEFKNLFFTNLVLCGVSHEKIYEFQDQFDNHFDEREYNEPYLAPVYDLCDSQRFDETMVRHSKKLISFHQALLLFCTDLEDFFSPLMLIQYSFFLGLTLFFNFAIISTNNKSSLLQVLPANIGSYAEMLFPCVIASIFTDEAENFQKELFEMPWYMCGRKFKTNYKVLLHRVNTPVTLTVGKISNLNLPLFLWVAKTINSYCIVLYQFCQSENE